MASHITKPYFSGCVWMEAKWRLSLILQLAGPVSECTVLRCNLTELVINITDLFRAQFRPFKANVAN